jgi:hypothetical protein
MGSPSRASRPRHETELNVITNGAPVDVRQRAQFIQGKGLLVHLFRNILKVCFRDS